MLALWGGFISWATVFNRRGAGYKLAGRTGSCLTLFLIAAGLFGQTVQEIKGTVVEQGQNAPLPGVEVTLTEFVSVDNDLQPRTYGTVLTDVHGAFSFKPTHTGEFRLNIKKEGYRNASVDSDRGVFVVLGSANPEFLKSGFTFALYRPASISGRVVGEDGKPVSGHSVSLIPPQFIDTPTLTDADGNFTIADLVPGSYSLRVGPPVKELGSVVDYSEEDFKKADRDAAVAYWPGDVSDSKLAVPLMLAPGSRGDAGTITLHNVDYYKVHVSVSVECASGERWRFALYRTGSADRPVAMAGLSCQKDFVLRHVDSGSYTLAIWTDRMETVRWGLASVDVDRRNEQVSMSLSPGTDLAGHFVIPEGVSPVPLANVRINLHPETRILSDAMLVSSGYGVDANGKFFAPNLPWSRYRFDVVGLRGTHYVKEIRYNRSPVTDGVISLAAEAPLEIVLDDHPATLSGTLLQGDKPPGEAAIFLLRRGYVGNFVEGAPPELYAARLDSQGHFQLVVAPGDYDLKMVDLRDRSVPLSEAPLKTVSAGIRLERGEQKTIDVKLPAAQ